MEKSKRKNLSILSGDCISLIHQDSGRRLYSHFQNYQKGSKNQEVVGSDQLDHNAKWIIVKVDDKLGQLDYGTEILNGDIVIIFHKMTESRLILSKDHKSPVSSQKEASCIRKQINLLEFQADQFIIFIGYDVTALQSNQPFKLIHRQTGCHLHSHSIEYNKSFYEITGFESSDDNDLFYIEVLEQIDSKKLKKQIGERLELELTPITEDRIYEIKHFATQNILCSQFGVNYKGKKSSKQQEVTCHNNKQELMQDSQWLLKIEFIAMPNLPFDGNIKHGDVIRLIHVSSDKLLHSHPDMMSPTTDQQEVTCNGENQQGDCNDMFIVLFEENTSPQSFWQKGRLVIFQHFMTGLYLHSHPYPAQSKHHQEVTCFHLMDKNNYWVVQSIRKQQQNPKK